MLTDAHHDWVHRFTGIHPAPPAADGAQGDGPALSPLPQAGDGPQAQAFKTGFTAALSAIDGDLGYTAGHAEAEAHRARVAKREAVVQAYGAVLRTIDPEDEGKAKAGIGKMLASVQGVRAEIGKFRHEAEKAFDDWQSRQAKYDDVGEKAAEMETWGHPKAAELHAPIAAVVGEVEARRYAAACGHFDKLLPQYAKIHDDYTRQKAAQAQYEPARKALDPRLAATQASSFRTLEPRATAFPPAQAEMDAAAVAMNFVHALELEQALEIKVTDYEAALAKLQEQKKAYDDAYAAIADKVNDASERPPPFGKMEPLQDDLEASRKQMQAAVDGEDFVAARRVVTDLDNKAAAIKQLRAELEAKKKDFEEADAKAEPRVTAALQSPHVSLAAAQKDIEDQKGQVDQAVAAQDYDGAKKLVDGLSLMLDQFDKSVQDLEAKKQAYDEKAKPIEDLVGTMAQSKHPKLKDEEQDIADRCQTMTDAAAQEDYTAAGAAADGLQTACDDYRKKVDAIARLKGEFDQKWPGELQKRADKMTGTRTDDLAALQQQVLGLVEEIRKAPETEEYEQGLTNIETLRKALDEYENSDETHLFVITFQGKPYSGTQKQLIAAKIEVTNKLVNEHLPNVRNLADLHQGHYNSLSAVNDAGNPLVFVMGAIVRKVGGADLDKVKPLIDAQFKALSAVDQAVTSDPKGAGDAYRDAIVAINTAGGAITHYLEKLEGGAETTSFVAEATATGAFILLAALAAPALMGAGMGAVSANVVGGAAAAGFETAVREGLGPVAAGYNVEGKDLAWSVAKNAGLGALAGLVGEAGMRKAVQETILKEAVKGLDKEAAEAMLKSEFEKEVVAAVDSGIVAAAGTIATNTPGFWDKKNPMTWEKFLWLIAISFVEGALAPSITKGRKLHRGKDSPTL